jgi:hypothetical protein
MTNGAMRSEVLSQVERVNDSHLLRGSDALRALLHFLAEHALRHPELPPKEQEIADRVFQQPSGFDPRVDSRVRVQIKRLREHLSKYYQEVGSRDRIVLQIPPGSYQLQFLYRDQAEGLEDRQDEARPAVVAPAVRSLKWLWLAAAILIGISIGWIFRGVAGTPHLMKPSKRRGAPSWPATFRRSSFTGTASTTTPRACSKKGTALWRALLSTIPSLELER